MDADDLFELPDAKRRRAQRIHFNRKFKHHDRYIVQHPKEIVGFKLKPRRFRMWVRENNRCKGAPETGYGVVYEKRFSDLFSHP